MASPANPIAASLGSVTLPNGTGKNLSFPGATNASAQATQQVLQDNHIRFHCFFNQGGFHNHLAHHVLALYSLGASPERIKEAYDEHASYQRPMPPFASEEINESNWTSHLQDESYYPNYLAFFNAQIEQKGIARTLERFLFEEPEGTMLVRSVAGAIHPLIHWGYGVEFGIGALVAEGLSQAVVHDTAPAPLFPPDFISSPVKDFLSRAAEGLSLVTPSKVDFRATVAARETPHPSKPRKGISGFEVLNNILADPLLGPGQAMKQDDFPRFDKAVRNRGAEIRQHCDRWIIDTAGGWDEVVDKAEELFWLATVIYAAATRPGYKPYKMDFFTMHALTSVLLLPPALEALSPQYRPVLLQAHFRTMVGYWISRGRPKLYITEVLMKHPAAPVPPNSKSEPLVNPWTGIIEATITHPDEHVTKAVRSLAYASSLFGRAPAGYFKSSLPGTDLMDGTIFVRAAGMTLDSLDWKRKPGEADHGNWDRSVLGFDNVWV